jgi:DNA polymerase III subunit delta'
MGPDLVLHPRTEKLVERLVGDLPHALIIEGPSGIGVVATANYLAHSMGSPALVIKPKKSNAGQMVIDEKEGNIIIEDIRQLYEQTRTKQDHSHVYILDTGERSMTIAAQNAFLKLLEEPRSGLHFIIATHHFNQLLPTIVSRSQRIQLLPVTDEQTRAVIKSVGIEDETKRARLAFVGRGLPALIKKLVSDEKAYLNRVEIMTDAKTMISGSSYDKIKLVQKYRDNRSSVLMLIEDMNYQLHTIIKKTPDQSIAAAISHNIDTHKNILAGGNIRIQLLSSVL